MGADYEDWRLAHNWVVGLGVLGENYNLRQVGDIVMSAGAWTSDLSPNGFTVRFYCPWADSHQGDPTKGFTTTLLAPAGSFIPQFLVGGGVGRNGTVDIDGLRCITNDCMFQFSCRESKSQKIILRNFLIDGGGANNAQGVTCAYDGAAVECYNGKIWECGTTGIGPNNGGTAVFPSPTKILKFFENITVYNCGRGAGAPATKYGIGMHHGIQRYASLKNVVSFRDAGVTGKDWTMKSYDGSAPDYQLVENCADSDGTLAGGTDIQNNIVPADEFQSLDDTESNFLELKRGEAEMVITANPRRGQAPLPVNFTANVEYRPGATVLGQSGIEPVYVGAVDISGEAIPGEDGLYSIGAHEQQYEWIIPELEG